MDNPIDLAMETSTSPKVVAYEPHAKPQTCAVTVPTFNIEISQDVTVVQSHAQWNGPIRLCIDKTQMEHSKIS